MGGSGSKRETESIDNKGLLNGNVINNGNINEISKNINDIENTFYIVLIVLIVIVVSNMIKCLIKYVKKQHESQRRLEEIVVHNAGR